MWNSLWPLVVVESHFHKVNTLSSTTISKIFTLLNWELSTSTCLFFLLIYLEREKSLISKKLIFNKVSKMSSNISRTKFIRSIIYCDGIYICNNLRYFQRCIYILSFFYSLGHIEKSNNGSSALNLISDTCYFPKPNKFVFERPVL